MAANAFVLSMCSAGTLAIRRYVIMCRCMSPSKVPLPLRGSGPSWVSLPNGISIRYITESVMHAWSVWRQTDSCLPDCRALPFGWYSFPVPLRIGGWVDLSIWLHVKVIYPQFSTLYEYWIQSNCIGVTNGITTRPNQYSQSMITAGGACLMCCVVELLAGVWRHVVQTSVTDVGRGMKTWWALSCLSLRPH